MPKGRCLKQNLPNGVINVVSKEDSCDSSTCQKPEFTSSLVKIFAPPIYASICSTDGRICLSCCTLLFNLVRSTQIQTFPLAFGTTTIPDHQDVGCSTFSITPKCCILFSSASTLSRSGMAICRGVVRAYGCELLCNLIM